jgi:excinuclease UvrABC nuclease subunit
MNPKEEITFGPYESQCEARKNKKLLLTSVPTRKKKKNIFSIDLRYPL